MRISLLYNAYINGDNQYTGKWHARISSHYSKQCKHSKTWMHLDLDLLRWKPFHAARIALNNCYHLAEHLTEQAVV